MINKLFFVFLSVILICPQSMASSNAYVTNRSFQDLYFDFTGHDHANYPKDRDSVAQDLGEAMEVSEQKKERPGPLVIATATGIYVYDSSKSHRLISKSSFRAQPNSGFSEITGISHIGPAIAYLAAMKKMGSDKWENHIPTMLDHIRAVKAFNATSMEENWLTKLSEPAWIGRELLIKNMVDYACSLAGNYLVKIKNGEEELTQENLVNNFFESNTKQYPIGFNEVMIGTFSIAALQSAFELYRALNIKEIDWKNAKVILHNQAGSNYSAGLTDGTNWLYPAIKAIAGPNFNENRIIIAPYAPIPKTVGKESLPEKDYQFLSERVWDELFGRSNISNEAFPNIQNITTSSRDAIPGDYGYTHADNINDFLMRLKYSTSNPKEMLSNSVGFWIAGEAVAKSWDLDKIDLPGLTHGLPNGLHAYPSKSPDIKE